MPEESVGSLASSSSGVSLESDEDPFDKYIVAKPLKIELAAATSAADATPEVESKPARKVQRSGLKPLWEDPYFSVWDNLGREYLSIHIRNHWCQLSPHGLGVVNKSKTVTPRHFGETRAEPTRSLILLRAWAVWRARQRGWADAQRGRARHFTEQEALIEQDIRALGAPCHLLGNRKANSVLQTWVPQVVSRLVAHNIL